MFCKNCGKQVGPEVNFCPACGTKVTPADAESGQPPISGQPGAYGNAGSADGGQGNWTSAGMPYRKLVRPRSPRMIAGVCAGLAMHFGWNLDIVRVVTVILGLCSGIGVVAYLVCWVVIPEAQYALPPQSR